MSYFSFFLINSCIVVGVFCYLQPHLNALRKHIVHMTRVSGCGLAIYFIKRSDTHNLTAFSPVAAFNGHRKGCSYGFYFIFRRERISSCQILIIIWVMIKYIKSFIIWIIYIHLYTEIQGFTIPNSKKIS